MSPASRIAGRGGPEIVTDATSGDTRPGWLQLMTTGDHKGIGKMYVGFALTFATLALCELILMRIQLAAPDFTFMRAEIFDRLLSIYGVTAVLLFAVPLLMGLISYVVPLQLGARGIALPRLHQLSFWLLLAGGVSIYFTLLYRPPEAGTSALPPLSSRVFSPNDGVDGWTIGVGLICLSYISFAVSMLTAMRNLRAPGMVWRRAPAFSWSARVICWLLLVIAPVMLAAVTMLFIDRNFGGVFFDPGEGGAPVLYEHLSWLFFTGIYATILIGAFGIVSEVLPALSRQPAFAPRTIAGTLVAFATLVTLAWMQNMYANDIPAGFLYFTMLVALAAAVAYGLLLFNWIATVRDGLVRSKAPMKLAVAAIVLMTIGLAGELTQAIVPVGWRFDDTMTAWGDTHITLIGGAVLGGFAGLHYWFPKLSGRFMSEGLGSVSMALIVAGTLLMGIAAWFAGFQGMAVDVYQYAEGEGLVVWNVLITLGALIMASGVILALVNAASSWRGGTAVGPDAWGAGTLEWFAPSPPPPHNFDLVPDVRSSEPLRDIREAVRDRATEWTPPPARPEGTEPAPVGAHTQHPPAGTDPATGGLPEAGDERAGRGGSGTAEGSGDAD